LPVQRIEAVKLEQVPAVAAQVAVLHVPELTPGAVSEVRRSDEVFMSFSSAVVLSWSKLP
jgi:hypothetical protein